MGFDSSFDISLTLIGIGFAQVIIVVTVVCLKLKTVLENPPPRGITSILR